MENQENRKIHVIRDINDEDMLVKEVLEIEKNWKILTYSEAMEILEPKLSMITIKK